MQAVGRIPPAAFLNSHTMKTLTTILLLLSLNTFGQSFSIGFHANDIIGAVGSDCSVKWDETDSGVKFLFKTCPDYQSAFLLNDDLFCIMTMVWPDSPAMDATMIEVIEESFERRDRNKWVKYYKGNLIEVERKTDDRIRFIVTAR